MGCTAVIFVAGNYFSMASSIVGEKLHLSPSVKGATLDAISSSLPELFIALFSVLAFDEFVVGVGTIAGSALFNLLLIPAFAVLVAGKSFEFSKEVMHRDVYFHFASKLVLVVLVIFFVRWNVLIACILLAFYGWYLYSLRGDTHPASKHDYRLPNWSLSRAVSIGSIMLLFVAGASYLLTEQALVLAKYFGVSPLLIAFTVVAVTTSLPDMVVSLVNAHRGRFDDSLSNALGSNTFNIFVGLGLPLFIVTLVQGPVLMDFGHHMLMVYMLIVTIIASVVFQKKYLTKQDALLFILLFVALTLYVITIG